MTVVYEGASHSIVVNPGPEGQRQFMSEIRRIYGLKSSDSVQLTFGCRLPGGSGEVQLDGASCFDAAGGLACSLAWHRIA